MNVGANPDSWGHAHEIGVVAPGADRAGTVGHVVAVATVLDFLVDDPAAAAVRELELGMFVDCAVVIDVDVQAGAVGWGRNQGIVRGDEADEIGAGGFGGCGVLGVRVSGSDAFETDQTEGATRAFQVDGLRTVKRDADELGAAGHGGCLHALHG